MFTLKSAFNNKNNKITISYYKYKQILDSNKYWKIFLKVACRFLLCIAIKYMSRDRGKNLQPLTLFNNDNACTIRLENIYTILALQPKIHSINKNIIYVDSLISLR